VAPERDSPLAQPAVTEPGAYEHNRGPTTPDAPVLRPDQVFPDSRSTEGAARLQRSLAGLAHLSADQFDLEDLMARISSHGLHAVSGADGASLTLLEEDGRHTVGATASFVSEIDHIQHQIGEGPFITALSDRQTVLSGFLGGDERWPGFGDAAARRGVQSVLSLPLISTEVVGALTVYAFAKHAFDCQAAALGETFAAAATVAVQNVQVLDRAKQLVARLQAAVATQATIDRAIGIIMSRSGSNERAAMRQLRRLSRHQHDKLPVVAQQIVDEAVRRAQSRTRRT
jgi:transcriptional regulator with GAF, ATPase, and Fis domain